MFVFHVEKSAFVYELIILSSR